MKLFSSGSDEARAPGVAVVGDEARWKVLPQEDTELDEGVDANDAQFRTLPSDVRLGDPASLLRRLQLLWLARCNLQRLAVAACAVCAALISLGFAVFAGCIYYDNAIVQRMVASTGLEAFGTETRVGSVNVGVISARTVIYDVSVANPPGFAGNFLEFEEAVLDTRFWDLLSHNVDFQEMSLRDLTVTFLQNDTLRPNFVRILEHLGESRHRKSAFHPPDFLGGQLSARKYVVDVLEMRNLTFILESRLPLSTLGLHSPSAKFDIPRVQILNVGKGRGGVSMEELMTIVVQAIVSAAVEKAPGDIGIAIVSAVEAGVDEGITGLKGLDYETIHMNVGEGFSQISTLVDRLGKTSIDDIGPEMLDALSNAFDGP
mmetsp:Transcript_80650/g.224453  ORF Transcript_80650/g.224453 Transcript_80650/m.224453 type:complete len:374 (+) Transcript_80650:37-1158(+)